jgi:hypothetical protein
MRTIVKFRSDGAAMQNIGLASAIAAFAAIATVTAHPAIADIKRLNAIPTVFWGSWASSTDGCKSTGDSVIAVSAKAYVAAQDSCTVSWISETPGAGGAIYSARLQCLNAQTRKTTAANVIFRKGDADQISVGADFSSLKIYSRCPATAAPR